LQFVRSFGKRTVVNPRSLGHSKAGDARARYAVWQGGNIKLRAFVYPVEETVKKSSPFRSPMTQNATSSTSYAQVPSHDRHEKQVIKDAFMRGPPSESAMPGGGHSEDAAAWLLRVLQ